MRVLQLIHDYLPLHAAGSEIYTANLCAALRAAGHEVAVFTCEEDRGAAQWSLRERVHDGVPVFEGIYNRIYHDLSEQWDDPKMAAVLDGVLARWKPDLLHVQGLQFVGGVSALRAAAARGIPIVMTLHEYWLLCPRAGLMFDVAGRACETATPADCARCVDIYPIDRARWDGDSFPELGDRRWFARALVQREADMREASTLIGRFIAPSRFLAERFAAAGFPRDRLVHADYGFPAPPADMATERAARQARRARGEPLRAGYVGTLSDYKGVETFARAVERLAVGGLGAGGPGGGGVGAGGMVGGGRRAHGGHGGQRALTGYGEHAAPVLRASIHGHLDWFPDVTARLRAIAARCGDALVLAGPFAQQQRDAIFAELDLLVVPSLWWENSPLTIHEAWQRGLPVLASSRGGMAELLSHGGGATFAPGDDAALAELLRRAASDPALPARWTASIPPVRALSEDVALLERLARELGVTPA